MILNTEIIFIIVFYGNIKTVNLFNFEKFMLNYRENIQNVVSNRSSERSTKIDMTLYNEHKCNITNLICLKSRYRTIDGSCNNLQNPTWGTPATPYARLQPYKYGDGIHSYPLSTSGRPLQNVREIRLKLFSSKSTIDRNHTLITMQWGQVVTHDLSRVLVKLPYVVCCDPNGNFLKEVEVQPTCAPMDISRNDPIYGPEGKICMNFFRTISTRDYNCTARHTPAQPLSSVTSYMDLSFLYGSNELITSQIRSGYRGLFLTVRANNGQEMLPNYPNRRSSCKVVESSNPVCYLAGDDRVNQNPHLAIVQIILLREHNRIAAILSEINRHWNDEKIFQETRRILIAVYQHITYYEYLPIIIGLDNTLKNNLTFVVSSPEQEYVNDYNPNMNPSVYNEYSSAAFRVFHSSIRGYLQKYEENRKLVGEIRLSDSYDNPFIIEVDDNFDNLARGLTTQLQGLCGHYYDEEISNCLFRGRNKYGSDLVAIDILRGRDHGLPSYVDARAACGLSVPKTFDDMREYISFENVRKLEEIYECVDDVELMVAGPLEFTVPNALTGPTFVSIITKQFHKTRTSDRYFYENGMDPDIAFSPSQLRSIRQGASMARLFCDNVASIKSMQPKAFETLSNVNKLVSCKQLPAVDLNLWKVENETN